MEKEKKQPLKSAPKPPTQSTGVKEPEFGGPKGPEPTRYGDWENKGRVSDF